MIDKTHGIMHDIDEVFGAETCKKVFGDITPNPFMIADFFDQIGPIAEKYANGRTKELYEKYNRSRKGNNSQIPYNGKRHGGKGYRR